MRTLSPLLKKGNSLIGFDGINGVGKTHLARKLADGFSVTRLKIDDFLIGNGEPYVSQIRYDALQEKTAKSSRPIVIDGVCLLEVAERCHFKLAAHIYVRLIGGKGSCADERFRIEQGDVEQLASFRRSALRAMNKGSCNKAGRLPIQIAQYHRDYKPKSVADFVFEFRM